MTPFYDPYGGRETRPHPAKFSDALLPHIDDMIPDDITIICDPMAGVGKITALGDGYQYYLNELEKEWAQQIDPSANVTIGDARDYLLPDDCIVVTSPPYGNRMADHFVSIKNPMSMKGRYAGDLGRRMSEGSTASIKFGNNYQTQMTDIYSRIFEQMPIGAYFLLNVSNFIALHKEVNVIGFYITLFVTNGFTLDECRPVVTPRDRGKGNNWKQRVDHEVLMLFRKLG